MHDGARHAEDARCVADGQVSGLLKVGRCHVSGDDHGDDDALA